MEGLISSVLPGVGAMANIHPMVVHFPIALLNAFLLMELLGVVLKREDMRTAATWMLYLGTLGAAATAAAGLWAASTAPHVEGVHEIMQRHGRLGLTVLSFGVFLSAWRALVRGRFAARWHVVHLVVALMTVVTMAFGADLGGLMVYKYGVAVQAAQQRAVAGHDHGHPEGG